MSRKIKSFKNKSFKKVGIAKLSSGIELPIRTLSISEETSIRLINKEAIPRKVRPATVAEIEKIKKEDPNFNRKTYPMLSVYDTENVKYNEAMEQFEKYEEISKIIKFIDMDCIVEESGLSLWQDLEIEKGDWLSVCKFFGDVMQLKATDFETILFEVRKLQGESVFEKIAQIKKLSGKDIFEVLEYIEKMEEEKEINAEIKKMGIEENLSDDFDIEEDDLGIEEKDEEDSDKEKNIQE